MTGINQLESLKVLKAVVECGSFTAAAKRLNVSTASVSKTIERLEAHLGSTLFNRSTRHLHITSNGEQCYSQSLELLNLWQQLSDDIGASDKTPTGNLRISAPMSWGLAELGPILADFADRYPEITLDIQLSDQHVNVLADRFDLALRLTNKLADSALLCQKITSYKRITCAAPSYLEKRGQPSQPDDLRDHDCLVYTHPGLPRKWEFHKQGEQLDVYLKPKIVSNNSKLLHFALLAGQGIAVIPEFIVGEDIAKGHLVTVLDSYDTPRLHLYSLRPKDRKRSYRLKVLHDFLSDRLTRNSEASEREDSDE